MQITKINEYTPSFEAVKIRQITPEYSGIKKALENELDSFVKNGDNAELLGKGLSAAVYKFKNFQDIVFKKSINDKTDFADEIRNLKQLPERLKNVQKYIAQAFDDETGLFYLISTKMNGKAANGQTNPWTRKHLKNMFETIFELDKNGIYHGDFNIGNILLDKEGNANLIDFQWMQKVERKRFFENKPHSVIPPYILSENSQMFEMASIPPYLAHCDNGKEFLKLYLTEKANYHSNRSNYLQSIIGNWDYPSEKKIILKGINYEDAQSVMYRHPDEDTLKIETKKLQFLSTFREAFSRNEPDNPHSNFITGATSHLLILNDIQDLRKEIASQRSKKFLSNAKKDYLKYTDEYAKYWFDTVKSWVVGIFENNIRQAEFVERTGIVPSDQLGSLTNIFEHIDKKFAPIYTEAYNLSENTETQKLLEKSKNHVVSLRSQTFLMFFEKNIKRKIKELKAINDAIEKAYKQNRGLDVINFSLLGVVKNRELKRFIVKKPNVKNRDEIITELHNQKLAFEKIARKNFKYVLEEICSNSENKLSGYSDMYSFNKF